MNVLGVDLSTFAIDLILLDENTNHAQWQRVHLHGDTAFQRTRTVRQHMPPPSWYDHHDVYLTAIERPFSQSRNDAVRLVEGAVLASIPSQLEIWETAPQTWKAHIGWRGRGKPPATAFPPCLRTPATRWPQDAYDALGVALHARDVNAAGIAERLKEVTAA